MKANRVFTASGNVFTTEPDAICGEYIEPIADVKKRGKK
jgi:hypothetical protein